MTTKTAELDKTALHEMNRIAQDVISGALTNAEAAEEMRKIRKQLNKARFGAKGA